MFRRGATTRRRLRRAAIVPAIGTLAVALFAAPGAAQTQPSLPFASGQLVSRSGATLDIKGFNGDTKVIVTSSTKYQQTQSADASAVKVGACIRVTGTGSASKGITATTVALSPAASKCNSTAGAGRFGGQFRNRNGAPNANGSNGSNGGNGQAPPGFGNNGGTGNANPNPNSNPNAGSGNAPNIPTDFGSINGKVTKVSGDNIVVKGTVTQAPTKANTRPKTSTKSVKVTLSDSTRVDQTVAATADVVTFGSCVTAAGTADSVGTVSANTVTVSQPVNGACTGGFGGFGGGGGFGPNGPPGNGSGSNSNGGATQ